MRAALSAGAIAAAVTWAAVTAGLGALATDIGPWYRKLEKPSWQPPDWLFGPVWTTIFVLAALAAVLVWEDATPAQRVAIAVAYVVNGLLNAAWSVLFFRMRRPDLALPETGILLVSILAMVVTVGRVDRLAGALLAPYVIWVCFAAVLNRAIIRLNGPFGDR